MTLRTLASLFLAGVLFGCASLGGSGGGSGSGAPPSGAMEPAVASTASSLGIKDVLVQVAVTAARNYLTKAGGAVQGGVAQAQQGATDLATQKQEAAKAGVQAAVDKAKADGQPLSEPQQSGLLGALTNLL